MQSWPRFGPTRFENHSWEEKVGVVGEKAQISFLAGPLIGSNKSPERWFRVSIYSPNWAIATMEYLLVPTRDKQLIILRLGQEGGPHHIKFALYPILVSVV